MKVLRLDGDGEAGGAGGVDDRPRVLRTADLEGGVDARLANAEVQAFALVLDLDEVRAVVGERAEELHEAAGPVVDLGEDHEPATGGGLVAADETRHDTEIDVAA